MKKIVVYSVCLLIVAVQQGFACTTFFINKACSMVQQYQKNESNKPVVQYAFDILDNVAQKGFTKWNDINRRVMEKAIRESKRQVTISDDDKKTHLAYANSKTCEN